MSFISDLDEAWTPQTTTLLMKAQSHSDHDSW